jgi:hypothetical protein
MKNWLYFVIALMLYMLIHEGLHAYIALLFNEYDAIKIHWYGPEVLFATPVAERTPDIKWLIISGFSNLITLLIGYLLFIMKGKIINLKLPSFRSILYYVTIVFLLFDAVNLSIGPFIYGGDVNGISAGLKIKPWIIQILFGFILLVNRELIIKFMYSFGISTNNILFKSWHSK